MKFTCSREKLLEGLNIVQKAVTGRSTLQILECVLITAENNFQFNLLANDLELGIQTSSIDAKIIEMGQIALEAKIFVEIVRKMSGDTITIQTMDNNITHIKSGKSEFKILGYPGDEFPLLPAVEKEKGYSLKAARFKNMIKQTIFSVSTDESKPAYTGELLEIEDNIMNMVAVDGFRVSYITEDMGLADNSSVIVPSKALSELSKILPADDEAEIKFYFTDKHILFELGNCIVVSRILEGDFIRYRQVFTEDFATKVVVLRQAFLLSLERASLISKDTKKYPIKLDIDGENMTVTSNTDLGTVFDELTVESEGNPIQIAFNPRYLIDALRVMDDEKIIIQFTTELSPCIIKGLEKSDYKYLVLPLRMKS